MVGWAMGDAALGFVINGSIEWGSTYVFTGALPVAAVTVGSMTFPITVLSQSFIPIGVAFTGSMICGFTGTIGIGVGTGSNVYGVGLGAGGTTGGTTGGGGTTFSYLWNKLIKQHNNPSNPSNPNNPGHHLQQSLSFLSLSIIIGPLGAFDTGRSITTTLVFGGLGGGGIETGLST